MRRCCTSACATRARSCAAFAEQGLWLLWSRSGDAEIDRLMARGTEAMQAGRYAEAIEAR